MRDFFSSCCSSSLFWFAVLRERLLACLPQCRNYNIAFFNICTRDQSSIASRRTWFPCSFNHWSINNIIILMMPSTLSLCSTIIRMVWESNRPILYSIKSMNAFNGNLQWLVDLQLVTQTQKPISFAIGKIIIGIMLTIILNIAYICIHIRNDDDYA